MLAGTDSNMKTLATELLTEIFHCLSRTDLEALQLVNARCYHVVDQHLGDGPVHCFDGLSVRGYNDYLLSPTRSETLCDEGIIFCSDEELMRHMRFAAVRRLRFVEFAHVASYVNYLLDSAGPW